MKIMKEPGAENEQPLCAARDLAAEEMICEFSGWMEAQGYPSPDDRYDGDEMAEAFAAGMQAEHDLVSQPKPAPVLHQLSGLIAGWRQAVSELMEQPMSSDETAEAHTLCEVIRQVLAVIESATSDSDPQPAAGAVPSERIFVSVGDGSPIGNLLGHVMGEQAVPVPNPGSDEALSRGCLCAVLDNCHGRGAPFPLNGWWVTIGCPLHTPPQWAASRG